MWSRNAVGLAGILVLVCAAAMGDVTFESLVREMTDLERLAQFPEPAYTCKQFSSYDQRSTDPSVLTDENWFANGDRGQHLRTEQRNGHDEWVMMDAAGPGCIVRLWSANPNDAGLIRIYIDEAAEPVVEMPMSDMLGGVGMPFVVPIVGARSRGWNCHLPIPYAKHCKVTASKPDFYYQVNYRTYAPGTVVESFSMTLAEQQAPLIEETAARLAKPEQPALPASVKRTPFKKELAPGQSSSDAFEGPGALYRLAVKAEADDLEKALRGCVIEITFDGESTPAVQAPLGDFFGTAPGANEYHSLPSGVLGDGSMYCHWVMPYAKSITIRLVNHTDSTVLLTGEFCLGDYAWTDRSMHFHAKWRGEHPIRTLPRQDWTYLACTGKGVFVGDMLHVTNPVKAWWGEGDEKIYVDGEAFPSHFGTGTEDYYGYAWCSPETFTHAYHNQPRCDGPGNYGQTCVSRFHVIDNIPFTKSFKFDIEVWHWAVCDIAMAATSYWYALPGGADSFQPPQSEQLKVVTPPPLPEPKVVEGALEGEKLKVVACSGGTTQRQESYEWGWSSARQLWWTGGKPGDTLELAFPVREPGRYEVRAVFTKAHDYGIARLMVNDKPAGDPMDFYNPEVVATEEQSLGVFDLRLGKNSLKVELTDKNDNAAPSYMFGLDYLLLKPVE